VLHVLNLATAFERHFHARSTVDSSPDSVVGQAEGRLYRFSGYFNRSPLQHDSSGLPFDIFRLFNQFV
jgi:hypothetical protein